ncbi:MAG TPA: hypothetical protein EYP18_07380, partial [Desulfobacterales bacterium]|nr:hypothetical protein [Desulfobacterales bacterium]
DLLAHEDIDDKDGDGISGKANRAYSPEINATIIGRFTWKASATSVKHQSANAAHNDMGLSNPIHPKHNCTDKQAECLKADEGVYEFDLPDKRLSAIAYYLKKMPRKFKGKLIVVNLSGRGDKDVEVVAKAMEVKT